MLLASKNKLKNRRMAMLFTEGGGWWEVKACANVSAKLPTQHFSYSWNSDCFRTTSRRQPRRRRNTLILRVLLRASTQLPLATIFHLFLFYRTWLCSFLLLSFTRLFKCIRSCKGTGKRFYFTSRCMVVQSAMCCIHESTAVATTVFLLLHLIIIVQDG